MNIALAIMHLYPQVNPMRDFIVQDNGPEPILRPGAEEKARVRYEIKPPEAGEESTEGVHYRYGIDYNLLTEGEDYDLVERGPYIAVWNLPEPQPSEAELQEAWEAYQEAEANKPPELTEIEQLQQENMLLKAQNNALSKRADFIEDIIAEMAMQVYQ
ncbi:XkdW family protein [Paenibacillus sp. MMS20-IR301]|uniref:XkdW family protein n=1 Tax=Paenibacillus sp. MMS20-IR301 TaxID=2895946 RepID=UPI0028EECDB7|nr:XkdW family protein [Paenibacillus sp. MMS20-IR301]WNS42857.1 XkdW family protein [Paenibacillus sp. MMS20-IR301]